MNRRSFLKNAMLAGAALGVHGCNGNNLFSSKSQKRPNILVAIADDATYMHMSAYGCTWVKTPGFDRVAQNGILFNRVYTPNAKCAPSRSCIITGRNSWQLEEAANHWCDFPAKFKTYPEVLKEVGYHTGYTAKGWGPGNSGKINGKRRELVGKVYNKRHATPPAKGIPNIDYAGNFKDFLDDRKADKPFCFWYGSFEPHHGYEYRSGINYGNKNISDIDFVPQFWPDNEVVRTDMLDYAFEIEHFDNHLGRMLKMLEERGELDNTLVVVTADNGMPFPRAKGQSYEYSNHLPLAIMWPSGINKPGRSIDDFVSFIDLAPTFLDVAGVSPAESGMHPIQGESLAKIFNSSKQGIVQKHRDHVLIGKERHDVGRPNDWGYPIRGIVKGDYLYIQNFEPSRWPGGNPETGYLNCDGSPTKTEVLKARKSPDTFDTWKKSFGMRPAYELYNIKTDPECMHNLVDESEYATLKSKLARQLEKELKGQQDPRIFGNGDYFDKIPYIDNSGKDFYNRYKAGEKLGSGWVSPSDFETVPPEHQKL